LLTLLTRLALAAALLRLAFVVLIHCKSPKVCENHLNEDHSNNNRTW
jgi:hypothetical protein